MLAFCAGGTEDQTWWTTGRGTVASAWSHDLLDRIVYGRQESWQEWPKRVGRVRLAPAGNSSGALADQRSNGA